MQVQSGWEGGGVKSGAMFGAAEPDQCHSDCSSSGRSDRDNRSNTLRGSLEKTTGNAPTTGPRNTEEKIWLDYEGMLVPLGRVHNRPKQS